MSFAPLDTSLIEQRLRELVPEFEEVNGAAAYHTLKGLQDFRTGTCYVVLAAESKPKGATIEVTAPERAFLRKHGVIAPEPAGLF